MRERRERKVRRGERPRGYSNRGPASAPAPENWIGSDPQFSPRRRRFRSHSMRTGWHGYDVARESDSEIISVGYDWYEGNIYSGHFECVYRKSDGRVFRRGADRTMLGQDSARHMG